MDGSPKFNAVQLGEFQVEIIGRADAAIIAKFALAHAGNGTRFGSIHKNQGWSEETVRLFNELTSSMERDAAADLFEGQGATTSGSITDTPDTTDGVPGL